MKFLVFTTIFMAAKFSNGAEAESQNTVLPMVRFRASFISILRHG
jgi:hypothetical protein